MDKAYQDSGYTTLFVPSLIFAGSACCRICTFESVHIMPSMLHPWSEMGFHYQRNGCMDFVTCSFRGENGKLDRHLGGINSFAVCNTPLTLSLQGTIWISLHLPWEMSFAAIKTIYLVHSPFSAWSWNIFRDSRNGVKNILIIHSLWTSCPLQIHLFFYDSPKRNPYFQWEYIAKQRLKHFKGKKSSKD